MPYVVTQACCADASCVTACPVNCIHPAPGEPGFATAEMLYVDGTSCVDCGACASACPVDAIKPHTTLTDAEQPFLAINAEFYDCFPHPDRAPLAHVAPQRRTTRPGPFRVAVVGAGPAGLYTADELLRHPEVSVDVLDRLPTPHGLVRAGVAPDHPQTKRVETLFAHVEDTPGFRYLLGVEVGRDVSLAELRDHYDAVVYGVGAADDRRLGIEGEDLPGSLPATALVGWYDGHPDHASLDVGLDHERVVVVGNGNVALDVARVLTLPPDELAATDVSATALAALRDSAVREVVVLGRRGPAQASFSVPELVGLVALADRGVVDVVVEADAESLVAPPSDNPTSASPTSASPTLDGTDPHRAAMVEQRLRLLHDLAERPRHAGRRAIVLRFQTAPVRLLGETAVTGIEVVRTRLESDADGVVHAVATDDVERLSCGLVLRSVGYRGRPVPDLPHDPVRGTVPNDRGRVQPGVYVAGWVKRGPTGFIGTNRSDAQETVHALLDDLDSGAAGLSPTSRPHPDAILDLLRSRVTVLDLDDWRAIDREERARGLLDGAPRRKITDVDELVAVAVDARAARSTRRRGLLSRARDYAAR